ncbi:MAG: MerR family transcriptional regulator [Woeseia sp.]
MSNHFSAVKPPGTFHVAELACLAEVTPATIRYYTRAGLLNPGREPENGYRCFSAADLRRVKFVRQAQSLGLTIANVRAILKTVDHGKAPCHQVESLVKRSLVRIRRQIADLQATENRIMLALTSWRIVGDRMPEQGEYCPLIERAEVGNGHSTKVSSHHRRRPVQQDSCCFGAHDGPAQCPPA